MKSIFNLYALPKVGAVLLLALLFSTNLEAQTKQIKRPSSRVGVTSVDNFVRESFDLYDKVYKYDGYAAAGTPLDDTDIDVLEDALTDLEVLSTSAPSVISDLDGVSVFKKAKATLQVNKAQKALRYSIKTAKELLFGESGSDDEVEEDDEEYEEDEEMDDDSNNQNEEEEAEPENISDNLEVYSKFDYVPGDDIIYFDDFSHDFVGDLPSKWNTNGSGNIVKFNKVEGNWFELKAGYKLYIMPNINELPEDYTIEFDILTSGLSQKTSSGSRLFVILSDTDAFTEGKLHYVSVSIPFGQYAPFAINTSNYFNNKAGAIRTAINADIRDEVKNQPHISISVTKNRYRLWVNEVKYVDVPRFIEELNVLNFIKFHIYGLKDGEEHIFINNLKVAEGGLDLRRKLMTEGRVSTNGIMFDSGSANIKPQSYGIIRQISQVLMQDESIKLNIIGHTDADGVDDANLKLSKDRAAAVRQALIDVYKISGNRLIAEGKGESEPLGDNTTFEGKAKNRRVEFIKN